MPDRRNSFDHFRRRSGGPLGRLHEGMAARMAAAFAVDVPEEEFLNSMRKRRDEMLRELKAPPSWRWFKRHILRSGDEVSVTTHELKRLLLIAEMSVPEDVEAGFLRVPLRPFVDLLAKAEARHEAKEGAP
jgi:hypothetical protein